MSAWYETPKFNYGKNLFISVGAAVVLVGALFKITHWPGATEMLIVGMLTEAAIFLFLGFLPPHKEYHWEKYYPGLDVAPDHHSIEADEHAHVPAPSMGGGNSGGGGFAGNAGYQHAVAGGSSYMGTSSVTAGTGLTAAMDKMLENAGIDHTLLERLGTNMSKLSDAVDKINTATQMGAATGEYAAEMQKASASLRVMTEAYSRATSAATTLEGIASGTTEYHEQVRSITKNLSALNAVYELELQDTNQYLKVVNNFYGNLTKVVDTFNGTMDDVETYKRQIGDLAKNMSNLNSIYGGMLSAMAMAGTRNN